MKGKFLPIGTICKINGLDKKIMITGFYAISYEAGIKVYDYIGYEYPEGFLSNKIHMFNHSEILDVIYLGYENEEHEKLNLNLLGNNNLIFSENKETISFDFDKNGVVTFDSTVSSEQSDSTKVSKEILNPFNKIYSENKSEENPPSLKGFSQFKFDSNGIVIAEEQPIDNKFKFDSNGVVISDETVQNSEPSKFKFDSNGVVISDGTVQNSEPSKFKFDSNGVVISAETVQNSEPSKFKFDSNGVVISAETVQKSEPSKFRFDSNGVVISDETVQNSEPSKFKFDSNGVVISDETVPGSSTGQFKINLNSTSMNQNSSQNSNLFHNEIPIVIQ